MRQRGNARFLLICRLSGTNQSASGMVSSLLPPIIRFHQREALRWRTTLTEEESYARFYVYTE